MRHATVSLVVLSAVAPLLLQLIERLKSSEQSAGFSYLERSNSRCSSSTQLPTGNPPGRVVNTMWRTSSNAFAKKGIRGATSSDKIPESLSILSTRVKKHGDEPRGRVHQPRLYTHRNTVGLRLQKNVLMRCRTGIPVEPTNQAIIMQYRGTHTNQEAR